MTNTLQPSPAHATNNGQPPGGGIASPSLEPDDLADLNSLADELHVRGCTTHLISESGQPLCLDVTIPGVLPPGPRVYAQAGVYYRPDYRPVIRTGQPIGLAEQAATIATVIVLAARPGLVLTLDTLRRELPGWTFWHAPDGQDYARRPDTPDGGYDARGDDPADLLEAIQLNLAWRPRQPATTPTP